MKDDVVYVIGIQEGGSCVLTSSKAYRNSDEAGAEIKKDREMGVTYTRLFTLHVR